MARLFVFMFLTVGLLALFSLAGIYQNKLLVNLGLMPEDLNGQFGGVVYTLIFTYIAMMVGSAVVIGFFGSSFSDVPVAALFASPLAMFIVALASLPSQIDTTGNYGFVSNIVWLIFAPLIIGYFMSLFDWVRGRD
jgi:uncharacterized membrane protein YccF (DUF307 family)